jgi:hypothetical protein
MNKLALSSALFGGIVAAMLSVAPASAQATRTWVSGVGDDANPCSRTAPCKTFAGAISKTAGGGEINVLDPGGFGGVTITKSISIRSTFEAGVLVSGTNGIIVNAGVNDVVILEGLDIEGLGTGLNGVNVLAGKAVYVVRCWINGFRGSGGMGVQMASSTANARVVVRDSVITNNTGGVNVQNGGSGVNVAVERTMVDGNTSFAVQANGATALLAYDNSHLTGSPTAISQINGGQVISFGTSATVGSSVVGGAGSPNTIFVFK